MRVRLLGEDLVAFRDTNGRLGVLDEHCPHRRASLALGRNEECGLRCLYHGWKVDVEGNVVDRPSEPRELASVRPVRHTAYPCREAGGFDCNWAQVLEGAIDSAHSSSLHSSDMVPAQVDGAGATDREWLRPSTDKAPRLRVQRTGYGFRYVAIRHPIRDADTHDYLRITLFVAPFTVLIPPNDRYNLSILNIPRDDVSTMFYFIAWSESHGIEQEAWRRFCGAQVGVDVDAGFQGIVPKTTDWSTLGAAEEELTLRANAPAQGSSYPAA